MWTAVVGECVSVGGVCVSRAGLGQYMEITVRKTTSPAHTNRDLCVEVRGAHFKNNQKKSKRNKTVLHLF